MARKFYPSDTVFPELFPSGFNVQFLKLFSATNLLTQWKTFLLAFHPFHKNQLWFFCNIKMSLPLFSQLFVFNFSRNCCKVFYFFVSVLICSSVKVGMVLFWMMMLTYSFVKLLLFSISFCNVKRDSARFVVPCLYFISRLYSWIRNT